MLLHDNQDPLIDPSSTHRTIFMSYVDAIIPRVLGALDLRLDDYLIYVLDHFVSIEEKWGKGRVKLSIPTADMLEDTARQYVVSKKQVAQVNNGSYFAALTHEQRHEVIYMLEQNQFDIEPLPAPFRNDIVFIKSIMSFLHQMVLFGYYSEWFSLGATRFAEPEKREVQRPSITWEMVHYPGTSKGYRGMKGFLVTEFEE
ncbi:hypothetical protein [Halalkalibacter sp. APA_J-10(15)]|uniref:hypothetical protein n=1 Tax=unclassified Halalkalibacter TaxID=2893063 RepID=UPI001FF6211D|nr:hypothetical protein [Halalkalibacter sp. APA_J-10(15)]MCK0471768.1 hypothetical protein [Halalkalibacter sp. APA_J-10(15)]